MDFKEVLELSSYIIPFAILTASSIGSTHCVAMCGPLCVSFTETKKKAFTYHLFRLLSYLILVSLIFFLKEEILAMKLFNKISGYNKILVFGFLAVSALFMIFGDKIKFTSGKPKLLKWTANFLNRHRLLGPSSIGFLNGFIPCGWLYSFLLLIPFSSNFLEAYLWTLFFWLPNAAILSFGSISLHLVSLKNKIAFGKVIGVFILVFSSYQLSVAIENINTIQEESKKEAVRCH